MRIVLWRRENYQHTFVAQLSQRRWSVKRIVLLWTALTLVGCVRHYFQPPKPEYKYWTKQNVSELDIKKSLLECGNPSPDPTLSMYRKAFGDNTEDEVANHVFHYSGRSIGIELVNDGDGHDPFPEAQLAALVKLLRDLKQRYGIMRDGVKRHSDLDHAMMPCDTTQRRKVDPGAAFPYKSILDRVFKRR